MAIDERNPNAMDRWKLANQTMGEQQRRDARSAQFNQEDAAYSPEIDPRFGELADAQEQEAMNFRNNLAGIQKQRGIQAGEGVRRSLAENMAGMRGNYSNRGLLYGGMARGQEAQLQAGAANEMLYNQSNINEQARQQASNLESSAYATRDQQRRMLQARKDALYNRRMGMIEERLGVDTKDRDNAAAAGAAAGQAAGMAAAYGQGNKQDTTTTTKKTS